MVSYYSGFMSEGLFGGFTPQTPTQNSAQQTPQTNPPVNQNQQMMQNPTSMQPLNMNAQFSQLQAQFGKQNMNVMGNFVNMQQFNQQQMAQLNMQQLQQLQRQLINQPQAQFGYSAMQFGMLQNQLQQNPAFLQNQFQFMMPNAAQTASKQKRAPKNTTKHKTQAKHMAQSPLTPMTPVTPATPMSPITAQISSQGTLGQLPPISAPPPVSPSIALSPVPPVTPLQPPVVPLITSGIPPVTQQVSAQESQIFLQLIMNLPDERAELFFRLYDCTKGKRKEERAEVFVNQILPKIKLTGQNNLRLVSTLLDVLKSNNDFYQKLHLPPIPPGFTRAKAKPIYKPIILQPMGTFEISNSTKERKSESYLIGSFISFPDGIGAREIYVDRHEIHAVQYGDGEFYYPICVPSRSLSKISISVPMGSSNAVTFFVVQHVERRPPNDVLAEIFALKGIQMPPVPVGRTPYCKGCCFKLLPAIEEAGRGVPELIRCPECGAQCSLKELVIDRALSPRSYSSNAGAGAGAAVGVSAAKRAAQLPVDEGDEVRAARLLFSEYISGTLRPAHVEVDWKGVFFGDAPEAPKEALALDPVESTEAYEKWLASIWP